MTKQYIISRFRKSGYKITRDANTSMIVVTTPCGFGHEFKSYRTAYMCYFPKKEKIRSYLCM